jgi:hypothetical protein
MSNKKLSVVSVEAVFAVNENVRWVGLVSARGNVILNNMRPGLKSHSSKEFDEEFLTLGPLTMLGVAEKYSPYLQELEAMVVWYGLMAMIYARLGSQVVAISIEDRENALSDVRSWLKKEKAELRKN